MDNTHTKLVAPLSAVDVLAVLDKCYSSLECGGLRHSLSEARAAVAELIEAAKNVADEYCGCVASVKYLREDDDVGERVCCGVVEYEPHASDCAAVRLRAALARVGGAS